MKPYEESEIVPGGQVADAPRNTVIERAKENYSEA